LDGLKFLDYVELIDLLVIKSHNLKNELTYLSNIQVVPNSERYDPVLSSEYFEDQQDIAVDSRGGFFRIYVSGLEKGAKPPSIVFVLLHGGGMSALTWAQMAKVTFG